MKLASLLLIALITLYLSGGCRVPRDAVVSGIARAADGLKIAYDVRGHGDITLLFIHCWCCDRSFWRGQLDAFADDYRVVALDLAGHGASGSDRDAWSVAGLAADVQALAEHLDLKRVILIGHSMGGPVALMAAVRMPERVIAVVCVDTVHNVEFRPPDEFIKQMIGRFEADFAGTMQELLPTMFPEDADPALVDWVIEKARAANQAAAIGLVRDYPDMRDTLAAIRVPVRAINAAPHGPGSPKTEIETNRKYADYDAIIMAGVGHYLMLERPEAFNRHLRQVLAELSAR